MANLRTMVGALCIVLAMVLGGFAGFVYARDAGVVGVSPTAGTRDALEQSGAVKLVPDEAATSGDAGETTLAEVDSVRSSDGQEVAKMVTPEEQLEAVRTGLLNGFTEDGSLVATESTEPPGTRYSGAGISAGGPYGGPDTFEGDPPITFTVTTYDPTILFYRWDFNNDGKFDYPDQTGGGSIGIWTTETTVTKQFFDNFYNPVVVQGWDGVSVIITISSGENLGRGTSPYWYVYPASSGFEFTPKGTLVVDKLLWFQWFSMSAYGASVRIWDTTTQSTIAQCTPPFTTNAWQECTLGTSVTLLEGVKYRIAEHKSVDYYPYFMGFYGPPGTNPPYSPPVPTKINVGNFFYTWGPSFGGPTNAYPASDGGSNVIMMIDFHWVETKIVADAAQ